MHKNGMDGSKVRRNGDSDFDARRNRKPSSGIRPAPHESHRYSQHVPLISNVPTFNHEHIWDGTYGAVSQPTILPSNSTMVTANNNATWIQQAQQLFQSPRGKPKTSPGIDSFQGSWKQSKPPPLQLLQFEHISNNNAKLPLPPLFSFEFSDDDDEADVEPNEKVTSDPPIPEFFIPVDCSKHLRVGSNANRTTLPTIESQGELKESISLEANEAKRKHRRNNSDFLYKSSQSHRRSLSADITPLLESPRESFNSHTRDRTPLPRHPSHRKVLPNLQQSRSFVASSSAKPGHRRGDSTPSIASIASALSEKSIVSDISRSVFYKKQTNTGRVILNSPTDKIRLVMDADLETGQLYRVIPGDDEEDRYYQYTLQSEESGGLLMTDGGCGCECAMCAKCGHKLDNLLYPAHYVLRVEEDIYQRVLAEISDSKQPCGIYFCGHHEDADKPSIFIAIAIIFTFLGGLLAVSFWGQGK
jgi:hypothetical protein